MIMNSILWTQNETPTTPETIIIDGKVSEESSYVERKQAFKKLNDASNCRKSIIPKHLQGNCLSALSCSKQGDYIFIKSHYIENDKVGRFMPFMFISKNTNINDVISQLKRDSSLINRTVSDDDILTITVALNRQSKPNYIWLIIATITIVLSTLIIINNK